MRDPKERVLDILDAIAAIERHPGRDKAAFEILYRLERRFIA